MGEFDGVDCVLHGKYPEGYTKGDKANLRRKCRNNFKNEAGIFRTCKLNIIVTVVTTVSIQVCKLHYLMYIVVFCFHTVCVIKIYILAIEIEQ